MDPLKEKFYQKSASLKAEIKNIVKDHGETIVDKVTVEQLIGGIFLNYGNSCQEYLMEKNRCLKVCSG